MDRTILLVGREKIGRSRIVDILSRCELPESVLVQRSSPSRIQDSVIDDSIWLIIINSIDVRSIQKFLTSLEKKRVIPPIIVISASERKELEVLISLGACDVIPPDMVNETVLTQSILTAVERKRIEAELTSRDAIMKSINYAAEVFLLHLDWDTRIEDVLSRFALATHSDKVCLYRNQPDQSGGLHGDLHSGWVSSEIYAVDQTHAIAGCEPAGYLSTQWVDRLKNAEIIAGRTTDYPSEEQPGLQKRQIKSLAIAPIFSDHVWWGFITFEHCRVEKTWNVEEIEALRTAARIFGAGISRVDAETRLAHLATHDFLTNLPNRMLFEDRFEQAIARAERNKKKFGIIAIDLDKFKHINDTYGHPFGDKVLIEIAWRLSEAIRTSDTCARVGGDEFTVVAEGINNKHDLIRVMEKLSQALSEPIRLENHSVKISASMGASLYPNHGYEMETLMKAADVALYQVKDTYSGYRIYSPSKQISLIEDES